MQAQEPWHRPFLKTVDGHGGGSLGLIKFSEGSGAQTRSQALLGTILDRRLLYGSWVFIQRSVLLARVFAQTDTSDGPQHCSGRDLLLEERARKRVRSFLPAGNERHTVCMSLASRAWILDDLHPSSSSALLASSAVKWGTV